MRAKDVDELSPRAELSATLFTCLGRRMYRFGTPSFNNATVSSPVSSSTHRNSKSVWPVSRRGLAGYAGSPDKEE